MEVNRITANEFPLQMQFGARTYRPGQQVTQDWNEDPQHPAPDPGLPGRTGTAPAIPSASRAGNRLTVTLNGFTDDTPGHTGNATDVFPEPGTTATFQIDQNGVKIAGGNAIPPDPVSTPIHATLTPRPSVIRLTFDASRSARIYPLSSRTSTVWTWKSAAQPGATLPGGWTCPSVLATNLDDRQCAAQPLLSLNYQLARQSLRGTVPAGPQKITISVGHFQPAASTSAITALRVQVSYNDGATWHHAAITRQGPGIYRVTYTPPAAARLVTLKTTAVDAVGATITETIWNAYKITA